MERLTAQRILDIQEEMCADQVLMTEYQAAHSAFQEILPHLPRAQQGTLWIILAYVSSCIFVCWKTQ